MFKSLLLIATTIGLAACAHEPRSTFSGRGPAMTASRAPASGPRAYRIYATAGSYGLAWGCENQLVDFERMDYDEAYEESLLKTCKIQNFLINTFEDRIVQDLKDEDYWVVRSHGMNHRSRGLESLGALSAPRTTLYSLGDGYKWHSTETLFASILGENTGAPYGETLIACEGCTDAAEKAIVKALKWENKVAGHSSSMSFERRSSDNSHNADLIVASYSAEVPKSSTAKSYAARALFHIELKPESKIFRLKLVKILNSAVQ